MNANSKQPAPKIEQWLRNATTQLKTAGIPTARLDAELILAHVLNKDRTWLLAHSDEPITNTLLGQTNSLLEKRLQRIPLAYITGHKEFYGRDFIVTPNVLVPRPETETLITVMKQLDLLESPNIHDIGTGSGCIAITIAIELPTSFVSGSDISLEAIKVARDNATNLDVKNVRFRKDNLMQTFHGPYDVITANLPYVDHSWQRSPETNHEPALALFADDHGLELIERCIEQTNTRLRRSGYLLLEADPEQHAEIIRFATENGFKHIRTDDYIVTLQR